MAYYKRNLPHIQFKGGEYFVTFRLFGSLPVHIVQELKSYRKQFEKDLRKDADDKLRSKIERQIFAKYESHLDQNLSGPHWLKLPDIARVVENSIHFRNYKIYDLYAYCVMSNHVHIVFRHIDDEKIDCVGKSIKENMKSEKFPVTHILGNLKKFTARKCNQILNRKGSFWQAENFDRLIRDVSELENSILYTLNNPVNAKLISDWRQWSYTYCKAEFLDSVSLIMPSDHHFIHHIHWLAWFKRSGSATRSK